MSRYHREGMTNCIVGVRGICHYAVMGSATFYKMYEEHEFPAMRLPDGRWMTSKSLIDEWIKARCIAQRDAKAKVKQAEEHGTECE